MIESKLIKPWLYTLNEFSEGLLYHGSSQRWIDDYPNKGSDNVFWTSPSPLVASTYLPEWSGKQIAITLPGAPNAENIYKASDKQGLGAAVRLLDPQANAMNEVDIVNGLAKYGYQATPSNKGHLNVRIHKTLPVLAKAPLERLAHAEDKTIGRLVLIDVSGEMAKFFAPTQLSPSDDAEAITKAIENGAKAVQVNQIVMGAQSKWGNFEYPAIGLSTLAINELYCVSANSPTRRIISIPAYHEDLSFNFPTDEELAQSNALTQWHKSEVISAFLRGDFIPYEVMDSYYEPLIAECERQLIKHSDGALRSWVVLNALPSKQKEVFPLVQSLIDDPVWDKAGFNPALDQYLAPDQATLDRVVELLCSVPQGQQIPVKIQMLNEEKKPIRIESFINQWESTMQERVSHRMSSPKRSRP